MNSLTRIAQKIIQEQEGIIGPLAWIEAGKVQGLMVNSVDHTVMLGEGDQKEAIDHLVGQYENIFGRASREVCREAVSSLIADLAPADVPSSLK